MQNNFNIQFLLGIVITTFGCLAVFVLYEQYIDNEYRSIENMDMIEYLFFGAGIVGLAGGIGLIFRQTWARWLVTIIAMILVVGWILFALSEAARNSPDDYAVLFILSACFILICMFVILLLHNKAVLAQGKAVTEERIDDQQILDAWEKHQSTNENPPV